MTDPLPQIAMSALAFLPLWAPQSALTPSGEEAASIAHLSWALFVGAGAILCLVVTALLLAIYGPERVRRALANERAIRLGGIIFPTATLALLLGYGVWLMRESLASPASAAMRIEVTGEQWWWRVAYPRGDAPAIAEANEVRIPVGVEIDLVLRTSDVIHSFWVPSLGGKLDMIPGRTNILRVKAVRPGIYRGQCAEYCGRSHALMALEVIAMPKDEFERWLAEPSGALAANAETAARGARLFLASGCGACHTVRGTAARGTIGPDLSRVGGRRHLAAATLPMTVENLARFVHDPQTVKPSSTMPPFAIFSGEDLHSLAAYLASLR